MDSASLVLLLTISCVAEVGFDRPAECLVKWAINADTASDRGIPLAQQVREYDSILRRRPDGRWVVQTPRARWIRDLRLDGTEPAGWPTQLSWPAYRAKWLSLLALAADWVEKRPPHPCPRANHYGGDCSDSYGACDPPGPCWERVNCGSDLAQAYWHARACPRGGSGRGGSRALSARTAAGFAPAPEL